VAHRSRLLRKPQKPSRLKPRPPRPMRSRRCWSTLGAGAAGMAVGMVECRVRQIWQICKKTNKKRQNKSKSWMMMMMMEFLGVKVFVSLMIYLWSLDVPHVRIVIPIVNTLLCRSEPSVSCQGTTLQRIRRARSVAWLRWFCFWRWDLPWLM
jgi:hypothetical protein